MALPRGAAEAMPSGPRLENGLRLPLRWCRMSTPGLAPFVGASCRGHPHSAARSWGAFLRMGETRPSRAPLLPTQPRPLSGPNGVAPRTPALRRCQDSLCSGCLGDGGSRGARGVSQRWGGVWRTEAGRWALVTGEDIAGRAETGRAMPGGPPTTCAMGVVRDLNSLLTPGVGG